MDFPNLAPSSRQYEQGGWPVKKYKAMDGYEVRLLYGSKLSGMTLSLEYTAIPDEDVQRFRLHFMEMKGEFMAFRLNNSPNVLAGWGTDNGITVLHKWRYDGPPSYRSLRPGVSTVSVKLIAVHPD